MDEKSIINFRKYEKEISSDIRVSIFIDKYKNWDMNKLVGEVGIISRDYL